MIPRTHRESAKDPRLNTGERLCLAILWHYADTQGECWPSVETLAADMVTTERETKRRLARLAELGHIDRRWSGKSSRTTVIRSLDPAEWSAPQGDHLTTPLRVTKPTPSLRVTTSSPDPNVAGDHLTTLQGDHLVTPEVTTSSPYLHGTPIRSPVIADPPSPPLGAQPPLEGFALAIVEPDPITDREPWQQLAEVHNRCRPKGGKSIKIDGPAPKGIKQAIADHGLAELALTCEGVALLCRLEGVDPSCRYYGPDMYARKTAGIFRDQIMRGTWRRPERYNRFSSGYQAKTLADAVERLRQRVRDSLERESRPLVLPDADDLPF